VSAAPPLDTERLRNESHAWDVHVQLCAATCDATEEARDVLAGVVLFDHDLRSRQRW